MTCRHGVPWYACAKMCPDPASGTPEKVGAQTTDPHAPGFRYARWPIGVGFARNTALHTFDRHGWWTPTGYGQTIHLGPVKVRLGDRSHFDSATTPRTLPGWAGWVPVLIVALVVLAVVAWRVAVR